MQSFQIPGENSEEYIKLPNDGQTKTLQRVFILNWGNFYSLTEIQ